MGNKREKKENIMKTIIIILMLIINIVIFQLYPANAQELTDVSQFKFMGFYLGMPISKAMPLLKQLKANQLIKESTKKYLF